MQAGDTLECSDEPTVIPFSDLEYDAALFVTSVIVPRHADIVLFGLYEQHHQANAEADQRRSDSCPNASVDVIAVRNFCDALDRDGIIPFPLDQQNLVSHKLDSQLVVLIEINAAAFILHAVGDGSLCSVSANWQG